MLIETPEGIVNTDHVVAITPHPTGDGRSIVNMSDGGRVVVSGPELFEAVCGVIVPAAPGFEVVTAILPDAGENGVLYVVEAVIAFRIGAGWGDMEPVPITVTGRPDTLTSSLWTLRQPNGACAGPDGPHDDLDAFKAACERVAERVRA